jgi:hypothetical protein
MAARRFAESQWSALVLPTLKLSTQCGYRVGRGCAQRHQHLPAGTRLDGVHGVQIMGRNVLNRLAD